MKYLLYNMKQNDIIMTKREIMSQLCEHEIKKTNRNS